MKDQLIQALSTLILNTIDGVKAGVTFLQAELPEVIHQLLMWKLIQSLIMLGLSLVVIITFVMVLFKGFKVWDTYTSAHDEYYNWDGVSREEKAAAKKLMQQVENRHITYIVLAIGFGLASIIAICAALEYGADALQITIAPKIYLIEFAAELAKSHK